MSRLERLSAALAVVVSRAPDAMASLPCKLENPLNGRGLGVSRGARFAGNGKRQLQRGLGHLLATRTVWPMKRPEPRLCVVLTRISPKPFDDDNNAAALKSIRDGMASAWAIDDGSDAVVWVTDWRKGPTGKDAVEAAVWVLP